MALTLDINANLRLIQDNIREVVRNALKSVKIGAFGAPGESAGGKKAVGLLGGILKALAPVGILLNLKPILSVLELISGFVAIGLLTVFRFFKEIIEKISNLNLKALIEKVKGWLLLIPEKIKEFITGIPQNIIELGSRIRDFIVSLKEKVAEKLISVKDNVVDWLKNVRESFVEKILSLKDAAVSWLSNVWDKLADVGENIVEWVKDVTAQVTNKIVELRDKFVEKVIDLKDKVVEKVLELKDKFIEKIIDMKDKLIEKVVAVKDKILELKDKFIDSITGLPAKIWDFLKSIPSMIAEKLNSIPLLGKLFNVGDAIIKPDGTVVRTDPKDTLIATQKPEGIGRGASNTFNFYGVTPQEMIDVIRRELGVDITRTGRF